MSNKRYFAFFLMFLALNLSAKKPPVDYLQKAAAYLSKGDSAKAAGALEDYFERKPADKAALKHLSSIANLKKQYSAMPFVLGTLYFSQKQYKAALPFLRTAAITYKDSADIHRMIGDILMKSKTTYALAAQSYARAITLDTTYAPKNAEALIELAKIAEKKKDRAHTIDFYKKAVSNKIKGPEEFLAKIGYLYLEDGNNDSAAASFAAALDIKPLMHDVSFHLGQIYEDKKEYESASAFYELAFEAHPANTRYLFLSARASFKQSNYPSAKQALLRVVTKDPKLDEALFMLGQIFLIQEDIKTAMTYFAKAYRLKPKNDDYLKFYAEACFKAQQYKVSAPLYKKYLAKNADDLEARANLGRAYMKLDQKTAAIAQFDRVISANIKYIEDDADIGMLYYREKKYSQAKTILENILRTHPENSDAQEMVGNINLTEGDRENAIARFKEATAADKTKAYLLKKIGDAYFELKNEELGASSYEKYLESNKDIAIARKLLALYTRDKKEEDMRRMLAIITSANTKDVGGLVALGEMDYANGDKNAALNSFSSALKLSPRHKTALYYAGKIYLEKNDCKAALPKLVAAVKYDPGSANAALALADLYVATNNPDNAIVYYKNVTKLDPANEAVVDKLTGLYRKKGENDKLLFWLRKKTGINPKAGDAFLELAHLYQKNGDIPEAETCYKRALEIKGESFEAYAALGDIRTSQKRFPEAIDYYKMALFIQAGNPDIHFALGKLYLARQDSSAAVDAFEKTLLYNKDHRAASEYLGLLYTALQYQDKAVAMLQKLIQTQPNDATGYRTLGKVYLDTKKYASAKASLEKAIALAPKDATAHAWLGDLYMDQKQYAAAAAAYGKAYQFAPANREYGLQYAEALYKTRSHAKAIPVLLKLFSTDASDIKTIALLMDCYLSLGQMRQAAQYIGLLEKADPAQISKNFKVAQAFYKLGKFDKALEILETMGPQKNKEYYAMLAALYKNKNRMDDAVAAYRELYAQDKGDLAVGFTLGAAYETGGNDELATEHYKEMEIAFPRDIEIKERLMRIYQRTGRDKNADRMAVLESLLQLKPERYDERYALAELEYGDGLLDKATDNLIRVLSAKPTHAQACALYAAMLLEKKRYTNALEYLTIAHQKLKDDRTIVRNLGAAYAATGQYDKARQYLEKAHASDPKNIEIAEALADVYRNLRLSDALYTLYKEIVTYDPQNARAHKGLGNYYYAKKQYDQAMASYTIAIGLDGNDPDILNRQAELVLDKGQVLDAIALLQASLGVNPNQVNTVYKLGVILLENQNSEAAAKEQFERAVSLDSTHCNSYTMLATIARKANDFIGAAKYYESALSIKPDDIDVVKSLAEMYVGQGYDAKAEPLLVKAVKTRRQDAGLLEMLAKLFYRQGKYQNAEKLFEAAHKQAPDNLQIMMDLIATYNKLGKHDKSLPILHAIAGTGQAPAEVRTQLGIAYFNQGNMAKAREILEKELSLADGTAEAVFTLGAIYYKQRDFRRAKIALKKAAELDSNNADALFYLGEIAYMDRDLALAAGYYEQVRTLNAGYPGISARLANCYQAQNETKQAGVYLEKAVEEDPNSVDANLNYGKKLFNENNFDEAQEYFKKAVKLMPQNEEPVYYFILCLIKGKKTDKAIITGKEAAKRYPTSSLIQYSLAVAYVDANEPDYALMHLQEAIKLDAAYKDAYKLRGFIYYRYKDNKDAAIISYKQYIGLGGDIQDVDPRLRQDIQ